MKAIIEQLKEFDTALLANTIGYVLPNPHDYYMAGYIQSVTPTLGPTCGVAVTCELDSSTPGGENDHEGYYAQLEEIYRMDVPVVWVVKAAGSRPAHECIMGDGMAKDLYASGCIGVVTDGGVRDIAGMLTVPFAAYSRGKTIHHCALRFLKRNEPVSIGGIQVRPGDIVHANSEGVITIDASVAEGLAAKAVQMRALEHEVHCVWRLSETSPTEKRRIVEGIFKKYQLNGRLTAGEVHAGGLTR